MLRVASCIAYEHDLILVAIAALICATGAFVAASLYRRTLSSTGYARYAWILLGATGAGSTIWCTHFVAMLAYQPGAQISYDMILTLMSLLIAIGGCMLSLLVGSIRADMAPGVGGGIFGASVVTMHYTGMAAFSVNGVMTLDMAYVAASVAMAIPLGAVAFHQAASADRLRSGVVASALIFLTIVALHFTGMAAITIQPLEGNAGEGLNDLTRMMLVFGVTGVGFVVLGTGAISFFLDDQAKSHLAARMRHMTESAVDGMAVVSGGKILETNAAFEAMSGLPREELQGHPITGFIEDPSIVTERELVRTNLQAADGSSVPVELSLRTEQVQEGTQPLSVYAFRDITQRIAHEKHISYLASYDSLTGLRNRSSFIDEASAMVETNRSGKLAVLAVDMDRFKEINDSHGHAAGDHVLQIVGNRIREYLDTEQMAARIGGDEFVIFTRIDTRDEAREIAEELIDRLSDEIGYEGRIFRCHASIGIALFPFDGSSVEKLMNNADLAMYRAKKKTEGSYCFYNREMDNRARERRAMIDELRRAIENGGLELNYQVQISVPTETVSGYEALVRWTHPEKGPISPGEFIPLAEQSGLIIALGEWVLRTACIEAASWVMPHNISVNLSAEQLADPDFASTVLAILVETGLPPSRLELEVTETSFITDQARATATLNKLKAMGISVSIDDFGTGYSSLAMLREFPFDKIKLDKSLIDEISRNRKAQGIFRAVLSLGDALCVPVLAEGVETGEQLEFLRQHGCTLVQGYYYGKPARVAAWEKPDSTATGESGEEIYQPRREAVRAG